MKRSSYRAKKVKSSERTEQTNREIVVAKHIRECTSRSSNRFIVRLIGEESADLESEFSWKSGWTHD